MGQIIIKNKIALDKMRVAGKLLAEVMIEIAQYVKEGSSTFEIDGLIEKFMHQKGLKPVCKGYGSYKYASCCSTCFGCSYQ